MADDEDDTGKTEVIPGIEHEIDELLQGISRKYALIQQRLEQQAIRLNAIQGRLEQKLAQESGQGRWLTALQFRLYSIWWRLRHRH